mmetsp:Transcript_35222/g.31679  ORF Transcript_35222/g.31679 Transcript_35222/m.31679 type:complete len:256 (-) Transcript_35222:687-1454(-)
MMHLPYSFSHLGIGKSFDCSHHTCCHGIRLDRLGYHLVGFHITGKTNSDYNLMIGIVVRYLVYSYVMNIGIVNCCRFKWVVTKNIDYDGAHFAFSSSIDFNSFQSIENLSSWCYFQHYRHHHTIVSGFGFLLYPCKNCYLGLQFLVLHHLDAIVVGFGIGSFLEWQCYYMHDLLCLDEKGGAGDGFKIMLRDKVDFVGDVEDVAMRADLAFGHHHHHHLATTIVSGLCSLPSPFPSTRKTEIGHCYVSPHGTRFF